MFRPLESLPAALEQALDALRAQLAGYPAVVVAYSGGVDSALVAAIAAEQLGERALAVTGVSPALAPHLREEARLQAAWMGIRQREIATRELDDPTYSSNPADRCYACKRELHGRLGELLEQLGQPGQLGQSGHLGQPGQIEQPGQLGQNGGFRCSTWDAEVRSEGLHP